MRKRNSPFLLDDLINLLLNFLLWQRRESKSRTSRLDCRGDFIDVVAENTESDVFSVGLDDCYQRGRHEVEQGKRTHPSSEHPGRLVSSYPPHPE